jgi:hypothetical protein
MPAAVIDKPGLDARSLAAEVAAAWAMDVADLVFMPVGLDGQAWAYRIDTSDGKRYFLKLRRGEFTRAAVLLPGFLRAEGVSQVVAPINAHRAELFRRGYGLLEPDQTMLSYYRSERHLDDVAVFLRGILNPEASPESQANDLHWLTRIAETVADPGYAA